MGLLHLAQTKSERIEKGCDLEFLSISHLLFLCQLFTFRGWFRFLSVFSPLDVLLYASRGEENEFCI